MAATGKRGSGTRSARSKRPRPRANAPARGRRKKSSARSRAGGGLWGERLLGDFALPQWPPRLPELDQRQRDVLALALVALGVFLGFVLYGGWDGGGAGHGLAVALGWSVGRARVLAPVALVLGGGVLLMRPVLPALRPLRTGSVCLAAGIVLALAAGTLGVTPGPGEGAGASARSQWGASFLDARGGAVGQVLYDITHRLVQRVGVDILVVFLLLVGVVLLTGASLASVLRATGAGMVDTSRVLRSRARTRAGAIRSEKETSSRRPSQSSADSHELGDDGFEWTPQGASGGGAGPEDGPGGGMLPPEPEDHELVVRATHVEAPSVADVDDLAAEREVEDAEGVDAEEAVEEEQIAGVAAEDVPPTG